MRKLSKDDDWMCSINASTMTAASGEGQGEQGQDVVARPVVLGRYQVDEVLGAGGMGFVALARDLTTGARVAIKLLRPEKERRTKAVERLLREARNASRLTSEHVCRVYDAGRLEVGSYIVMEYLNGVDLRDAVRLRGLPGQATVVDWMQQACAGLAEAHALGIVHRDIKPANLFLAQMPDGRELVKVIDFGLSSAIDLDPGLTMTREVLGTPRYMAPEQLRSVKTVDARADVWSLGVVMYELLARARLFQERGLRPLVKAITGAPIPRLGPEVPAPLAAVVARCLDRDLDRRFADAGALGAALGACELPATDGDWAGHRPDRASRGDSAVRSDQSGVCQVQDAGAAAETGPFCAG